MRLTRPLTALVVLSWLTLASPSSASAQGGRTAPAPSDQQPNAEETRQRLEDLLRQYPPSLGRVLYLDPTLLDNAAYLQTYPALASFLAAHAEVKHNAGYYLATYDINARPNPDRLTPQDRAMDIWRNIIESISIGAVMLTIAGGLIWLLKTLIEYRRWSRVSKIQTEVHTKLLDRFTTNEELLAYIQTPVGRRFLESAPIPIDAPQSISAPVGRILWSVQVGAVLTVLGLGIEVVARYAVELVAGGAAALGAIVIALGIGFLVSAALAYSLSRRFGLMQELRTPEARG